MFVDISLKQFVYQKKKKNPVWQFENWDESLWKIFAQKLAFKKKKKKLSETST